ncbi:MAG: aminotransferase class I/II-fold pyridoxal phosphate-dependent enzyme [Cyclobacteriaceae bacterium]|nr:aminotransferase class I/II-fold pyridoxal phosphate-dependent enzyme [Cyclobacteriaceae bacterium]
MINGKHISVAKRTEGLDEYYFSRKLAEVRALSTNEYPVINLGIGNPDLPPPDEVIDALTVSARNPMHHGYQSYTGIAALREAMAAFTLRFYGYRPDAESEVLPLIGSKEGIVHISLAFLNEGDEVLVPDPGYPAYAAAAKLAGAVVKSYPISDAVSPVDIDALRNQDLTRVKLMWINFPHMPTGRTCNREVLKELVALAREKKFLIVNDNAYALIRNAEPISLFSVAGADEVGMELNSLSKSHNMAGWRLGWVTARSEFIRQILRVKSNMDSGMFLPVQHAAVAALQIHDLWFVRQNEIYHQRSQKIYQMLKELNCTWSAGQAGLFVWARLPERVNDKDFIDELLYGARVFITPGSIFGDNGRGYIRISLCAPEEKIDEAIQRIRKWKQQAVLNPESITVKS